MANGTAGSRGTGLEWSGGTNPRANANSPATPPGVRCDKKCDTRQGSADQVVGRGQLGPVRGRVRQPWNGNFVGSRKLSPKLGLLAMLSWWCSVRRSCTPRALCNVPLPNTEFGHEL